MVQTVLVAMDESPQAREALSYAIEAFPTADIVVVHVAYPEYDMLPSDTEETFEAPVDELDGIGDETAQTVFEAVRSVVRESEVPTTPSEATPGEAGAASSPTGSITVSFLLGDPADRIVEYAEEEEFDTIVVGTHGREGVSRLLIGSVAETVVRQTTAPTVLVK